MCQLHRWAFVSITVSVVRDGTAADRVTTETLSTCSPKTRPNSTAKLSDAEMVRSRPRVGLTVDAWSDILATRPRPPAPAPAPPVPAPAPGLGPQPRPRPPAPAPAPAPSPGPGAGSGLDPRNSGPHPVWHWRRPHYLHTEPRLKNDTRTIPFY